MPMRDELDPRPLMFALKALGAVLALPRVVAKRQPLAFHVWDERPLVESRLGVKEPAPDAALIVPDLILVPLLAFDRRGVRLGYGGGCYDATLAHLRSHGFVRAVGLAFTAQEVDDVPHDASDQPLDAIVTERELISIR
jgi:5-formyltetrahydrofolate cyclo-ligase